MWTVTKMLAISVSLAAVTAFGQGKIAFEVATIKLSAPIDTAKLIETIRSGGQVAIGPHAGPHRAEYLYMDLKNLIAYAYQVKPYRISGPDWLAQQRFDIIATYPQGATRDDAPRMLQALLEERFRLKVHKNIEEHPVLALVTGKGTSKLKASGEKPAPIDDTAPLKPGERKVDGPSGKPMLVRTDLTTGAVTVDMGEEGRMSYKIDRAAVPPVIHIDLTMVTLTGFANMMTQILTQIAGGAGRPIIDMTHIEGNYDASFDLSVEDMLAMMRNAGLDVPGAATAAPANEPVPTASDPARGGQSLADAVRSLGLKLESRKAPVEQLVVDHAEKNPIEN